LEETVAAVVLLDDEVGEGPTGIDGQPHPRSVLAGGRSRSSGRSYRRTRSPILALIFHRALFGATMSASKSSCSSSARARSVAAHRGLAVRLHGWRIRSCTPCSPISRGCPRLHARTAIGAASSLLLLLLFASASWSWDAARAGRRWPRLRRARDLLRRRRRGR